MTDAARGLGPYVIVIIGVWLGWQIISAPVLERGPPLIAIRIAPTSAMVLTRAAEAELAAKRFENADDLARRALRAAPFGVRALSVAGLVMAERNRAAADDVLTLAGNRSLRHDPTHAWLMNERLRRGDYVSSFAHADTLVRRRQDVQVEVFKLFTTAAREDRRAMPALISLIAAKPPWRTAYFDSLYMDPRGADMLATLAVALQNTPAPLDDAELGRLYTAWINTGRIDAIRTVRDLIGRPKALQTVADGDFSDNLAQAPFAWTFDQSPEITSAVLADDTRSNDLALRVERRGSGGGLVARQFLLLNPGAYLLQVETRLEHSSGETGFSWKIKCVDGRVLSDVRTSAASENNGWMPVRAFFVVTEDCPGQWVVLEGLPDDRRNDSVMWFDKVQIQREPR